MALKGDMEVVAEAIRFRIETGKSAEKGCILVASSTDGTAAVPDTGITAAGIGGLGHMTITSNLARPVGLLLNDVEDLDFTTRPQIFHRRVVGRGGNVQLLKVGRVKTNWIGDVTPAQGQIAYLAASGKVSNVEHATGSGIKIGHFESSKDADGYAHLWVNIEGGPQNA